MTTGKPIEEFDRLGKLPGLTNAWVFVDIRGRDLGSYVAPRLSAGSPSR